MNFVVNTNQWIKGWVIIESKYIIYSHFCTVLDHVWVQYSTTSEYMSPTMSVYMSPTTCEYHTQTWLSTTIRCGWVPSEDTVLNHVWVWYSDMVGVMYSDMVGEIYSDVIEYVLRHGRVWYKNGCDLQLYNVVIIYTYAFSY